VDARAFLTTLEVCIERRPHSQVLCNTPVESCREYNRARAAGGYSDACFDDLIGRLEVPNDRVKWDKPLFEVEARHGSFSI
jgi:tRNA uridine 5-carbamoylmethylation protein Kti12